MKISYSIIETTEETKANERYTGYGLRCVCGTESAEVKNISPNRKTAQKLADLLEREAVEPIHLFDVIYDLLAGGCIK